MPTAKQQDSISEAEYLDGELVSEIKHEYVNGQVYAMSGASLNHETLCGNLLAEFILHLKKSPCRAVGSNMKVRTLSRGFRYPDIMVVCENTSENPHYLQDPVILVEVLSRSTRKIDEQTKRIEYINIPSLQEYVLIDQDVVDIEIIRRKDNWFSHHYYLGDTVTFESIGLALTVEEIYHRVENDDMKEFLEAQQDTAEQ